MKNIGKPCAGKLHARFDEGGQARACSLLYPFVPKANVYNLGGWARRAVLNSSRVLPSDERTHWLKMFINNSPVLLDRWVARWVQQTA